MDDILTRDETAKLLKVTRSYLDRIGTAGPRFTKVGRLIRYRRSDVEAWLFNNLTAANTRIH